MARHSNKSVAIEAGINEGMLYHWVRKYKAFGYNGLIVKTRGRKPKESNMKKKIIEHKELNESEREELIRLREENEYNKIEIAAIKKEIASRQKKEAARLKTKKQKALKNLEKKDIN